ncbi:MAG TPA: glycosyltransferase family 2 protein [Candidatus Saccharibacteria bacterium]|nr:glycosyltransferase family 2 protein [Candidatus Saccharibacteria bacterium]HMR38483.1 glycosyltransferase family 2 protein [Candidatus Saccharibacteria bacterium]
MTTQKDDLELPLGKRTPFYRFFEIVPGALSYGMLLTLLILSIFDPFIASIFILLLIITMVFKAAGIAYHSYIGYKRLQRAQRVDWSARLNDLEYPEAAKQRLSRQQLQFSDEKVHYDNIQQLLATPDSYPKPSELFHLIVMPAYNEPYEVIEPTVEAILSGSADSKKMIMVFAYEERGGADIKQTAKRLQKKYQKQFYAFMTVEHPANLPGEVIGKGANITYAAKHAEQWVAGQSIDFSKVIVTTLDCDNKPHQSYFDYVAYEFIVHQDRKHLSYQPIALYFSNIWDAPAPMRVIATGNSFWTVVSSMRQHQLRNFAAHSQPMDALSEMGYWSTRSIVEDGHQYWRSYFFFKGNYSVVPIHVPVYQDAVMTGSLKGTLVAQFKQLRRWAYGASDVPFVAERVFTSKRTSPFWPGVARFMRLIDSHVTLATIAIVVAIGGWIPLIINPDAAHQIVVHNLPATIGQIQQWAMIGIFVTVFLTLKMLPPRPKRYRRTRTLGMVVQWVLLPFTSIGYSAVSALNAQTHLMFGKYLDKFDVTEKAEVKDTA